MSKNVSNILFALLGFLLLGTVGYFIYKLTKDDKNPKLEETPPPNPNGTTVILPSGGQYPTPLPPDETKNNPIPDGLNEEQDYYKALSLCSKYSNATDLYNDLKKYGYQTEWLSQLDVAILIYYVSVAKKLEARKDGSFKSFVRSLNGTSEQWMKDVDYFYQKVFGRDMKVDVKNAWDFVDVKYDYSALKKYFANRGY